MNSPQKTTQIKIIYFWGRAFLISIKADLLHIFISGYNFITAIRTRYQGSVKSWPQQLQHKK